MREKSSTEISMHALISKTGLTRNQIRSLMKKNGIEHDGSPAMKYHADDVDDILRRENERKIRLNQRRRNTREKSHEDLYSVLTAPLDIIKPSNARVADPADANRVRDNVEVVVKRRQNPPASVYLRLGPTNSGKTYASLERLSEAYSETPDGTYVYAGPLRMLAYEVYLKLAEKHGYENVGFLTGEEQINPDAPILACTVEMTPMTGTLLILDEAHWAAQQVRGNRWTALMHEGEYQEFHIIAATEAKDALEPLFSDAWHYEVVHHERRTPIEYGGMISMDDVPDRSAVVCFSRASVYAAAKVLSDKGKKVSVLYGTLPLAVRKSQIEKYLDGTYDIMVVTDVIGHGINLPIDNIVFAETVKFDGEQKRNLYTWEGAQIAGRAGRYGYSEKGMVYLAEGMSWFSPDEEFVEDAVEVARGTKKSDLDITKPFTLPAYPDLGLYPEDTGHLFHALQVWESKAIPAMADLLVGPASLTSMKASVEAVASALRTPVQAGMAASKGSNDWKIDADLLWQIITVPLEKNGLVQRGVAEWLNNGSPQPLKDILDRHVHPALTTKDIHLMEKAAGYVAELRMAHLAFSGRGDIDFLAPDTLTPLLDRLSKKIIKALPLAVKNSAEGMCDDCGVPVSPKYLVCRNCDKAA